MCVFANYLLQAARAKGLPAVLCPEGWFLGIEPSATQFIVAPYRHEGPQMLDVLQQVCSIASMAHE